MVGEFSMVLAAGAAGEPLVVFQGHTGAQAFSLRTLSGTVMLPPGGATGLIRAVPLGGQASPGSRVLGGRCEPGRA